MSQLSINTIHQYYNNGRYNEILNLNEEDFADKSEHIKVIIHKIKCLGNRSRYNKMRELLDTLYSDYDEVLDQISKMEALNLEISMYLNLSKFKKAEEKIEKLKSLLASYHDDTDKINQIRANFKLNQGKYYLQRNDLSRAYNYIYESKVIIEDTKYIRTHMGVLYFLANYYQKVGNLETADEIQLQRIELVENKGNSFLLALGYLSRAQLFINWGKMDKGEKILDKVTKINENLNSLDLSWNLNLLMSTVHQYRSQLDKAIVIIKKNLSISNLLKSDLFKAGTLNNLGNIYNFNGNIDLALDYHFQSLKINKKFDDPSRIASSYNNIALNYKIKGELDRALEFLNKSLDLVKDVAGEQKLATSYVNLGMIHNMKGNLDKAKEYFVQCLEIDKKYGNDIYLSETLFNLINLEIDRNNNQGAKAYLNEFEELVKNNDNKMINLRYKLGKAIYLKTSKRSINQAKAQELLKNLIEDPNLEFDLYVTSIFHLCDLLLVELKHTNEEEVLDELNDLINKLEFQAKEQKSHSILAKVNLIKSRLALIELDTDSAREYIDKAEKIAVEKGLKTLQKSISLHQDNLLDQTKLFQNFDLSNLDLQERLEQSNLEDLLGRFLTSKEKEIENKNEIPIMFLIIKQGGVLVYRKRFEEEIKLNESLISNLLTAIYTLTDEVFKTQKSIQRMKLDEYTTIIKPDSSGRLLYCYIFKGWSYPAINKLDRIIKMITDSNTIKSALNREIPNLSSSEIEGMDYIIEDIIK